MNNQEHEKEKESSLSELSARIEETHHTYLEKTMPEAAGLLATILRVHGLSHPELFQVYRIFGSLKTESESHRILQEYMLFPLLEEEEEKEQAKALIDQSVKENEGMLAVARELSRLTDGYRPPKDACPTFRKAYALLKEIDQDLQKHLNLENQMLFC